MGRGDLRVNAPLHHVPELGLVVVAHASGTPLMQRIWRAPHDERPGHLAPAAQWLRKYTRPTEDRGAARLAGWLSRARAAAARQPYAHLRPVEAALLAETERIAAPLAGTRWRTAICHGDFHPNNLLVDGPCLTGIDTGGSARLPVYKDMARFLAHMGRRGLVPSRSRQFGVDRAGLDAFAAAFELDGVERGLALPFMIGIEALIRVESSALTRARLRHAEAFYEALLTDLRGIAV
jgi:Ser/Thr protein kinase RdoA (MazF antagonist)